MRFRGMGVPPGLGLMYWVRLAIVAVLILGVGSCGKKQKASPSPTPNAGVPGLQAVVTLPRGEVETRASVDVIFDRPMVPLGSQNPSAEEGERYLVIEPRLNGYYRWVGTRTLSFVANADLPPATLCRARIPAGVTALDGAFLEEEVSWGFRTPRPQLEASIPGSGDRWFRPEDPILLAFNLPVDPGTVAAAATVNGAAGFGVGRPDSTLLAAAKWTHRYPSDHLVVLRPSSALPLARAHEFRLDASLRGAVGNLEAGEPLVIPFRTYGPLRLVAAAPFSLEFTNPVDRDSVLAYLEIDPPVEGVGAWGSQSTVRLHGAWKAGQKYTLTLRRGLPDLLGQRLAETIRRSVRAPDAFPRVRVAPDDGVLLPDAPRRARVTFVGVKGVHLRAVRLTDDDAHRLRRSGATVLPRWTMERTVYAGTNRNQATSEVLELGDLVPPSQTGSVLVEAEGWYTDSSGKPGTTRSRSLLCWSNLGLTLKAGDAGGMAWASRLTDGALLPGVSVSLRGDRGQVLWSGVTGANGSLRLPPVRDWRAPPYQATLTATSAEGSAQVDGDGDWQLSPWRFGVAGYYGPAASEHAAFVYGDRDIYRPAETVHLAGLLRRRTPRGVESARLKQVRAILDDALGATALDTLLDVDAEGGVALDVTLPIGASLGTWNLRVVESGNADEGMPLGSTSFRVAEYRPPAFLTEVESRIEDLFPGDSAVAHVSSAYAFGAPVAGAAVRWYLVAGLAEFAPPGFEDFQFTDPEAAIRRYITAASGNTQLDASGKAAVVAELAPEWRSTPWTLTLEASTRDPGGDEVSGRTRFRYHPASIYAGLRASRRFVAAEDSFTFAVAVVDPLSNTQVSGTPVTVEFIRREWRSVRKMMVGGRVGYETSRFDTLLGSAGVVSGSEPVTLNWSPPQPGSYRIRAVALDATGRENVTAIHVYASGRGRASWKAEDSPVLEIATDREFYRPGDIARVMVTSSLQGRRGVLTVEREGILSARPVEFTGEGQVFEVPVEGGHVPNVYVGVSVLGTALTEDEAPGLPADERLPRYQSGYVELKVDTSGRRLDLDVVPARDEVRPGEEVVIRLGCRDAGGRGVAGRLGVAVVDATVLALLQGPLPDPFAFFYAPRPLAVRNADTRLRMVSGVLDQDLDEKMDAGGGGGAAVSYRSDFATTAYWNPRVTTDASGNAEIRFRAPDNLTRFKVLVVGAVGADRFGTATAEFQVSRAITVEPVLPRFALVGDTLRAVARVTNRTSGPLRGSVNLETSLVASGDTRREVTVESGATVLVSFPVVASQAGESTVRMRASLGQHQDAVSLVLPVADPLIPVSDATAGRTSDRAVERIALPAAALPQSAQLRVGLASSAIAGADRAFSYVLDYPFGCLEQTASRLLVLALYRELLDSGFGKAPADLDLRLRSGVDHLQGMLRYDGVFTFWPGQWREAPPYLCAWAAFALARAARAGAPVDPDLLKRVARNLRRERSGSARGRRDASAAGSFYARRAIGMGLLAGIELQRAGVPDALDDSDLSAAADHRAEFPGDERMLLALALSTRGLRPEVCASILEGARNRVEVSAGGSVVSAEGRGREFALFASSTRATSLALLLAMRLDANDPLVPELASGLLGLREQGHWRNTHDDVFALLALVEYRGTVESGGGQFLATLSLPGNARPVLSRRFEPGEAALIEEWISPGLRAPRDTTDLRFAVDGSGTLHYAAELRWQEAALQRGPREDGLTLVRRVERLEGNGVPTPGDLMVVTLEIVNPYESRYLALVDPLPAGLEAVDTNFRIESETVSREFAAEPSRYAAFPVSHLELRDRELRVFADFVPAGIYEFRYLARVRASGSFGHLPAHIEAMYAPDRTGATAGGRWLAAPPGDGAR